MRSHPHRHAARQATAALLLAPLLAPLLAACSNRATAPERPTPLPACTFVNPVVSGADPWVVRDGGMYYMVESDDDGIYVYESDKLTQPKRGGVRVWSAPAAGWNRDNVWAPELHHIDGRWYIYYAAGPTGPAGAPFVNQRSFVLESVGDDPQGAYVDRGMLYTGDDVDADTGEVWAIDLTTQVLNGQRYAVWSGWERNTTIARTPQHLYIARMSNPWTISSNLVKISSPTESWERREDPVDGLDLQEGPEFLVRDTSVFIIYSTRESWLPAYRLGQLRLAGGAAADPMNPASYVKSGPVFQSANGVIGVGHNGFTVSPDGTEHWLLYHAKVSATPGWDRVIRMQPFTWNADGSPNFGAPVASGTALEVPAGECAAARR
jgi:GH43 family beta-xylosidase